MKTNSGESGDWLAGTGTGATPPPQFAPRTAGDAGGDASGSKAGSGARGGSGFRGGSGAVRSWAFSERSAATSASSSSRDSSAVAASRFIP